MLLHRTEATASDRPRPPLRARAAAVVAAVAAALAVWVIAVPLLGVDLQVAPGSGEPQAVGVANVVVSGLVGGLAAWGSLAVLERLTTRPRRIWTVVAVAVLALSLMGPQAGTTAATTTTLVAMHLAVGAVLIPVLAGTTARAGTAGTAGAQGLSRTSPTR